MCININKAKSKRRKVKKLQTAKKLGAPAFPLFWRPPRFSLSTPACLALSTSTSKSRRCRRTRTRSRVLLFSVFHAHRSTLFRRFPDAHKRVHLLFYEWTRIPSQRQEQQRKQHSHSDAWNVQMENHLKATKGKQREHKNLVITPTALFHFPNSTELLG